MKESEYTILYPCSGTEELGSNAKHIYSVNSKTGPWATKEKARERFPRRINLLTSGEYVLCPICQAYKDGKLEVELLK